MSECKHVNWTVIGTELIGSATCLDCCETYNLSFLVNCSCARMLILIKKLEHYLEDKNVS